MAAVLCSTSFQQCCALSLMSLGMSMGFVLYVWQPTDLSVLQGGLQLSVDLRDSAILTYICKHRRELKRLVCGQRKAGALGDIGLCMTSDKILSQKQSLSSLGVSCVAADRVFGLKEPHLC